MTWKYATATPSRTTAAPGYETPDGRKPVSSTIYSLPEGHPPIADAMGIMIAHFG